MGYFTRQRRYSRERVRVLLRVSKKMEVRGPDEGRGGCDLSELMVKKLFN